MFSPSKPLTPATDYKAILKSDILQFSKFGKISKAENINFHTPDLHLDNTNITWIMPDENNTNALPQIDLYFNYPVNPNLLKEKLKVEVDGQVANYNLQTLSADNKITLRLINIKMEDKDYDLKVSVDKGLVPEGGINGSKETAEIKSAIPSPLTLRINDISTEHDGVTGTVKVTTSQQIVATNISSLIKIEPAVKFNVEVADDGFVIRSDNFDVSKSYKIDIAKGMRGRIGGVLHDAYDNNITFGQLEPSISFANNKSVYLASKGLQNIEVKIINVEKVKVIVSKIYENNLLAAQRYGYSPRDNSAYNNEEGDYNSGDENATFGDIIYEKEIDTRSLPKYGNSRLFNFNIADKMPDFKGIYHVMIRSGKDYWVSDNRFISLSDIGLIAKEGKEKILVFANSIKNANAMAGVNMIAYGANNQVLGMAQRMLMVSQKLHIQKKNFQVFVLQW